MGKTVIKATNIWQNIRENEEKKEERWDTTFLNRHMAITPRNGWLVLGLF